MLAGCRAKLHVSQAYLISEQYPAAPTKLRKGFDAATAELRRHVDLLRFTSSVIVIVTRYTENASAPLLKKWFESTRLTNVNHSFLHYTYFSRRDLEYF